MKDTKTGTNYTAEWALEQAVKYAKRSGCQSKRGVVIWSRDLGYIAGGWNAPPQPFICDGSDQCKAQCSKTAVHAEQAALVDMAKWANLDYLQDFEMLHVKVMDGKAVISDKPSCWQCSKLILEFGLKSMWLYQKEGLVEYTPLEFHTLTLKNNDLNYILRNEY